jgi:diguanylate cyclase (GGDEF)-like protein
MKVLFEYIYKIPKKTIPVFCILLIILLGLIDVITGYEVSFSIFYLLPVMIVSWYSQKYFAVILSILSALTWLMADLHAGHIYPYFMIPVWNAMMRLGFFLIVSFALLTIRNLLEKEQSFARVDFLTGVMNSRAFSEMAKTEIDRTNRFKRPLTIAYVDIDNFKEINDTFGHNIGDKLLQSMARTIKEIIRTIDIIARLGGDEFAILFPETNEENAKAAISKVQKHLLHVAQKNNWAITFSIGVITCYSSCELDELIKEADDLMYSAKASGKNRVAYKIHETSETTA